MTFLTPKTDNIYIELSSANILSEFTFVGGSALAYYLNHRLSEDLDFFTWTEFLPKGMDNFLKNISASHNTEIINYSGTSVDLIINGVNVTFFANNWEALKTNRIQADQNIYTAGLDLLCGMKINTLSMRAKYRDYYDLYVLNKEKYDLREMFNIGAKYIPGMTKKIFAMQLIYIDDIDDEDINHLSPKYIISLKEISEHFSKEVKKTYF